jgi:hypothetical protein
MSCAPFAAYDVVAESEGGPPTSEVPEGACISGARVNSRKPRRSQVRVPICNEIYYGDRRRISVSSGKVARGGRPEASLSQSQEEGSIAALLA